MDERVTISAATEADVEKILALLTGDGLPTDGVAKHWRTFIVARDGDQVVACAGAEAYQSSALIRSVVVRKDHRGTGLGRRIVRQLLDRLTSRGLREFYLLTTTAEKYFKKRGFKTIDRDEVNPEIAQSEEFRGACPENAVCMRLAMLR